MHKDFHGKKQGLGSLILRKENWEKLIRAPATAESPGLATDTATTQGVPSINTTILLAIILKSDSKEKKQ